jgi:LPS sulfotransferase NodH
MGSDIPANAEKNNESPLLVAYAVGEEHLQLFPAPASRDWMDKTHQHFANRCLPMLMANQSGWFLVSKLDVSVVWNGGQAKESLSITTSPGVRGHAPAVSIFGHGILTWHIPYLFRTPAGFNLLARGPANWPRENAFALEGLVETDWAVATFTMNYKILRANEAVHFRAGEPVCMIVPQRRGELEAFQPFIRSINDDPAECKGYRLWSASRGEFLKSLTEGRKQPATGGIWQKHYFRGTSPDGTTAGAHDVKRDLATFGRPESPSDPSAEGTGGGWAGELFGAHLGVGLSYVICSSPRSGSTLLAEALSGTRVAGRPDEFFDVHQNIEAMIRRRFGAEDDSLGEYLIKVLLRSKTDNGVFGWKAHWHQFEHFWRRFLGVPLAHPNVSRGDFTQVFPNLRFIWLRRRDRLRQAISYARAMQTDLWRQYAGESKTPQSTPAFDKPVVDARIDEIDRMETAWNAFFTRHGIEPWVIWYEDFITEYQSTVRGALGHLEIRLPENFVFPQPRLLKQSDQETEKWIAEYRGMASGSSEP